MVWLTLLCWSDFNDWYTWAFESWKRCSSYVSFATQLWGNILNFVTQLAEPSINCTKIFQYIKYIFTGTLCYRRDCHRGFLSRHISKWWWMIGWNKCPKPLNGSLWLRLLLQITVRNFAVNEGSKQLQIITTLCFDVDDKRILSITQDMPGVAWWEQQTVANHTSTREWLYFFASILTYCTTTTRREYSTSDPSRVIMQVVGTPSSAGRANFIIKNHNTSIIKAFQEEYFT